MGTSEVDSLTDVIQTDNQHRIQRTVQQML